MREAIEKKWLCRKLSKWSMQNGQKKKKPRGKKKGGTLTTVVSALTYKGKEGEGEPTIREPPRICLLDPTWKGKKKRKKKGGDLMSAIGRTEGGSFGLGLTHLFSPLTKKKKGERRRRANSRGGNDQPVRRTLKRKEEKKE